MIKLFRETDKQKTLYAVMTLAAIIGFLASFWQIIEKIALLQNSSATLVCNINSVFSCSNILNAWQSSVFGFPNSLMCVAFFAVMMTAGLVGWTGGTIYKNLRLVFQGATLFFIGFGFWYLWQSIFAVGSLCVFCIFCYGGVLAVSYSWLRLNQNDLPIGKKAKKVINKTIANGSDIFIWLSIAMIIVLEMIIKFS